MRGNTILFAVGLAVLVYGFSGWKLPTPDAPPAIPETRLGRRILEAFRKTERRDEARKHAKGLARLCRSLAEKIRYDGTLPKPQMRLGVHFDELRRYARELLFGGVSLGGLYPDLTAAIDEHFTTIVGVGGGQVDAAQRDKWAAAFSELADASEYATGNL